RSPAPCRWSTQSNGRASSSCRWRARSANHAAPLKLVASDLDGTLVRSDGKLSDRTIDALKAVEDAGVLVVLVTGRPPRWMRPIVEATGHRGLAICANGALIYDLETEQITKENTLDPQAAATLAR